MKTLKIACAMLFLLAGILGCSSDTQTEAADRVEISGLDEQLGEGDVLQFSYDVEQSVDFNISTNKTWSIATSGLEWLTVSQMNGGSKLPATVSLMASDNDDLARSGSLTIYAGGYKRTITVSQQAFPIVPTITLSQLTENRIELEFSDTDPVTFTLYSNVAWTALPENLSWADVSPLSGERKQEATITVTPTANTGDARQGTITFSAEGATPVVVSVSQTEFRDEPVIEVLGTYDGTVNFFCLPSEPKTLTIQSNRNWEISKTGLDWLTVSPASGTKGDQPVSVTLTAGNNTGTARTGTLTIRSADPALSDTEITVSQDAYGNMLLASWALDYSIMQVSNPDWPTTGKIMPETPRGNQAIAEWKKGDNGLSYTTTLILSSDGHYAVKCFWTDDNLEFSIPVKNFAANTQINIRFAMSGVKSAPKYYTVEYYDNGVWKATSSKEFTHAASGNKVTATYELTGNNLITNVDETATFTQGVDDGQIKLRIRCAKGAIQTVTNTILTAPATGGTIRIRPWSTGSNDAINIYQIVP